MPPPPPPTSATASGSAPGSLARTVLGGWFGAVVGLWAQESLGAEPADLALSSEPVTPRPPRLRSQGRAALQASQPLSELLWLPPSPLP